jgi:hypothetical protein
MTRNFNRAIIALAALALCACASTGAKMNSVANSGPVTLQWTRPEKRVVLKAPQFDLRENTIGHYTRHRDDWTRDAGILVSKEIGSALAAKGIVLVSGEAAQSATGDELANNRSADYALTLDAHGNYDPPGRAAWNAAALAGLAAISVPLPGIGIAFGLTYLATEKGGLCDSLCQRINADAAARGEILSEPDAATLSLIDLRTGNVAWWHSTEGGDWRDEASARKAIANLLKDAPF